MRYTDLATEMVEVLSSLLFGGPVYIDFFKSGPKQIIGKGWQTTILPTMAYSPPEDVFVLEENNLDYLLSRILNRQKRRKTLLTMISHELRHRVQYRIPETILWSDKDKPIKARKDVLVRIKKAKQFIRYYYPKKAHSIELDAHIISYLVAEQAGESLEHIAEIIRYGPLVFEEFPDWLHSL